MNEETAKAVAAQLRKPEGEAGLQVGEKMNASNKVMNEYVIDVLKQDKIGNVLEIGMGNGFFIKDILAIDDSIRYTGCDYSETMIEEAAKYNKEFIKEGKVKFDLSAANSLPYGDYVFDTIFTVNTIYFWEKPEEVFSEIRGVLKPGGRFIIAVRPSHSIKDYPFVKYGFAIFSREELADILKRNQFIVTEVVEKEEPETEFNGQMVKGEVLIMCASPVPE